MDEIRREWSALGTPALLRAATEPARTPELHPLVTRVTRITGDDRAQDFVVEERVPLGPLPVPNRYRARRVVVSDDRLVLEAWSWPRVHLVHTLEIRERGERIAVEHVVAIDAPAWIRGFVVRTARAAHDGWIARVRAWIAAQHILEVCSGESALPSSEPYREGLWSVRGARGGASWEILVGPEGPALLRAALPGQPGDLHPRSAFGYGGLDGAGFAAVPAGHRFEGWLHAGALARLDDLPGWAAGYLLAHPEASIVAGKLVSPHPLAGAAALRELLG